MAKGYRLQQKLATLTFDGTEYEGAKVEVRLRISTGAYFEVSDVMKEDPREGFRLFARKVLVSWNLEYGDALEDGLKGKPIPANEDGILEVDPDFLNTIISSWRAAVESPPAPLSEQ